MVVISLEVTELIGVTQERTALPSTSTVQAPHCASPQPNLAPFSSRSLRKTYSSGVSGSAGTDRLAPLTFRVTAIATPPGLGAHRRCCSAHCSLRQFGVEG